MGGDGEELLAVRVRLFADLGRPANVVIAGRRPPVKPLDQVKAPDQG
jgi:hypothetical protein